MQNASIVKQAMGAVLLAIMVPLGAGMVDSRTRSTKPVPQVVSPDQGFGDAVVLFREQRMSAAYGRFMALAQQGDVDAARIAQFMHRYGPVLFNTHWDASTDEVDDWTSLARTDKRRPTPRYMPDRLNLNSATRTQERARLINPSPAQGR